jgi:hypothetical protein
MFPRFHQTPSRLQVSLRESRRIGGKPRCEHIASLGSIPEPMTTADRVAFWARLHQRLAKLSNRISAEEQGKILGAIHARIPMVTIDELRTLQRENSEADEKFWAALQGMNAEQAEGHKELAAKFARVAAAAEAQAKISAEKAAFAKDRIERLAKGEDVKGGLGKPMTREDYEKILMGAGWSRDDINFSVALAGLADGAEFENYGKLMSEFRERRENSDRWKVLRQIRANRGGRDA